MEDYIDIVKIARKLIDAGSYIGLFLFLLFVVGTLFWHLFVKSYITKWGESFFNINLERYKNELNKDLGNTLAQLYKANQKRMGYHSEMSGAYKNAFSTLNIFINELMNFHHGEIDRWNSDSLLERKNFLSNLSSQLRTDIALLDMYSIDEDLISELRKIQILIMENIYSRPKEYLLKQRELIGKSMDEGKLIENSNALYKQYNDSQIEAFRKIAPNIRMFTLKFRLKYKDLIEEDV